jgi:integrase
MEDEERRNVPPADDVCHRRQVSLACGGISERPYCILRSAFTFRLNLHRHVVKEFAAKIGAAKLAPHDLRRSCARLCRAAGGELKQIQFLLGHVSIQNTERYLGCTQRISSAVNDRIGIEPTQ